MIRDNYITPDELNEISFVLRQVNELEEKLNQLGTIDTGLLLDEDGLAMTFEVRDRGGILLGYIGHTGNGYGLYLDDGLEVKDES